MQYPAVILPFSQADPEKDPVDEGFKPLHEADAKNQAMCKLHAKQEYF
jgi:amidase